MNVVLRKIGNSSAIIIPKPFLKHLHTKVGDELDLSLKKDHLVISPIKQHPRTGWAQASKKIAQAGEDKLVWPEFANNDQTMRVWNGK